MFPLTWLTKRPKFSLLLICALFGLLLSGCSFIAIHNTTELSARVLVKTPDSGRGYTRFLGASDSIEVFSSHGGRYTVTLLPDQEYIQLLEKLRDQISNRLFQEGATLTVEEVALLVQRMDEIDRLLGEMANRHVSCAGSVPDFETATVILGVNYEDGSDSMTLTCH